MEKTRRLLLKLSGEMLLGSQAFGIEADACKNLAANIQNVCKQGYEVAIVIGAGNLFRGQALNTLGLQRTPADQMGMLATMINGLALQQALNEMGCLTHLMSALECPKVAENYNWSNALQYLNSGQVVIFAGGTGNPYFTTDTAAALRASEIGADYLLKATKVNGVYERDPKKDPSANRYQTITYRQYLAEELQVMDSTAVALCMNNKIPILVFNMDQLGSTPITELIDNNNLATLIKD